MAKIILEQNDIKELENLINNFPSFAKNVQESITVARASQELISFLESKIVNETTDKK